MTLEEKIRRLFPEKGILEILIDREKRSVCIRVEGHPLSFDYGQIPVSYHNSFQLSLACLRGMEKLVFCTDVSFSASAFYNKEGMIHRWSGTQYVTFLNCTFYE